MLLIGQSEGPNNFWRRSHKSLEYVSTMFKVLLKIPGQRSFVPNVCCSKCADFSKGSFEFSMAFFKRSLLYALEGKTRINFLVTTVSKTEGTLMLMLDRANT